MSTNQTQNWQTIVKEQEFNDLLMEWNAKINLVSRKKNNVFDLIEDSKLFFEAIDFTAGVKILDLGTGGGFPGIIIAINQPQAELVLIDSIQKKIKVVSDIIERMEIKNARAICIRAEDIASTKFENGKYLKYFDYVVSRSVAVLQDLCYWSKPLLKNGGKLVTVKGGDISGEVHKTRKLHYVKNIFTREIDDRKLVVAEFSRPLAQIKKPPVQK